MPTSARPHRRSTGLVHGLAATAALFSAVALGCSESSPTAPGGPGVSAAKGGTGGGGTSTSVTVTATVPDSTIRDTTVDVLVQGSGFDKGSQVTFLLNGSPDSRVRTNSTKFMKTTQLTANITIAADAVPTTYDVQVTTSTGKKGIGNELFTILPIIDVGGLGGGSTTATSVNGTGVVAGYSATGRTCNGRSETHPFVWTPASGIRDIGVPAGYCNGVAWAINASNVIAGSLGSAPARWSPDGAGGWQVQVIGGAAWTFADANDINDGGQMVGEGSTGAGMFGWFWSEGTGLEILPMLPGASSCVASGINNNGQMVGNCMGSTMRAVLWSSPTTVPIALPTLGLADGDDARRINDAGIAVGNSGTSGVRWVPGGGTWTVEDLGSLGGQKTAAKGINNAGQIVGWSYSNSGLKAFLWESGKGMRDLGVAKSGDTAAAYDINDPVAGGLLQIAGWDASRNHTSGVTWQPR